MGGGLTSTPRLRVPADTWGGSGPDRLGANRGREKQVPGGPGDRVDYDSPAPRGLVSSTLHASRGLERSVHGS